MTGWFSPFLFYLARCAKNALRRQVELLKKENSMMRRRVLKKRIFLNRQEKNELLKLGAAVGSGAHKLITIVHPRTYQRWVREKRLLRSPRRWAGHALWNRGSLLHESWHRNLFG